MDGRKKKKPNLLPDLKQQKSPTSENNEPDHRTDLTMDQDEDDQYSIWIQDISMNDSFTGLVIERFTK